MGEIEEKSMFLEKLRDVDWGCFIFRRESILNSPYRRDWISSLKFYERTFMEYEEKGDPIQGMDLGLVKHFSRSNLQEITDNFSRNNFVRNTLNGRLFKGVIKQDSKTLNVLVKTWDFFFPIHSRQCQYPDALADELLLLTDQDIATHPDLVKLFGYSCHKDLAIVYDFKLNKMLKDLIPSDEFYWDQRIKVALGIAEPLKFLHEKEIALGSLCPFKVLVDEEFKIKLYDFDVHQNLQNMNENDNIVYKISNSDRRYHSPDYIKFAFKGRPWVKEYAFPSDVYSYGFLLLELIAKKMGDDETETDIIELVAIKYPPPIQDKFVNLAIECVDQDYKCRPTMHEVVSRLKDLVKELSTTPSVS